MGIYVLMCLGNPMTWLIAMMAFILWSRFRERINRKRGKPTRRTEVYSSTPAAGLAFQFLSIAYRPNHAFIAKAAIQQQEDTDDDDEGGPDTPTKYLHRQLRRIRRGEPVDRLIWKLE
jgi:hypothetical protein